MPKWGLTSTQIDLEPWGIAARWLKPSKTVTDPVHGDIYLTELEQALVDTAPFQRLRRVRQLGTSYLVYPGATHTRFSHSLGTLRAAQDLLDAVVDSRNGPRPAFDVFADWESQKTMTVLGQDKPVPVIDFHLARVTVLTRVGALLHDFCHVPFGHTIEDDLGVLDPHDKNVERFNSLWRQIPRSLRRVIEDAEEGVFFQELKRLILSKAPEVSADPKKGMAPDPEDSLYPFVSDIVGNTICADLLDYIARDHLFTGLPMALGRRFQLDFYVTPTDRARYSQRMVVRITRDGHERADIVTEIIKHLRYRYELSERVLYHHAKAAADAMVGKLLEMWSDWLWVDYAGEWYPELVEPAPQDTDLDELKLALSDTQVNNAATDGLPARARRSAHAHVRWLVSSHVEGHFTSRGDEGLLEYLRDWAALGVAEDDRRAAVGTLARAVLNRDLFKVIGRAGTALDRRNGSEIHRRFGDADTRRTIEMKAADRAGLKKRWRVVVWMPPPKMRLKVAEVLVESEGTIVPLDRAGHHPANEIYDAHENLWTVTVYADPEIAGSEGGTIETLLSVIGTETSIRMRSVRTGRLMGTPWEEAAELVADGWGLPNEGRADLMLIAHESEQAAAMGGAPTMKAMKTTLRRRGQRVRRRN